jgi:alkanesulfonate monooxygenase SsuD/methylene tetrahydromethanopterin reductase-like flavin-dependent oxidoreductase (luciferase family)
VAEHLRGTADDELSRDFAVARCKEAPVPVISAAMSTGAARRAARRGVGIIGSSLTTLDHERRLTEVYQAAGGTGPDVLIRHVWLGDPPWDAINAKRAEYRQTSRDIGATRSFGADEIIASHDPTEIAARVEAALAYTGKTCLHLRVHVPDIPPELAREQIRLLGERVLPLLRRE